MSSTSKARLQALFEKLDHAFANAHADDRPELIKELRGYLSRQNTADSRPYDKHHSSAITAPLTNA